MIAFTFKKIIEKNTYSRSHLSICQLESPFLGRFRIFENRPLDPVLYFLSKCEKKISEKKKKKTEKLSTEIQTHLKCSAWLSMA